MTQLVKSAIISSIMSFAFVSGTMGEKCERLEMYDLIISGANIESDLLTGSWSSSIMGFEGSMYFQENGLVEIISTVESEDEISIETWQVQMMDSHSILTLTSQAGVVRSIKLYPTCDGFATHAVDGSTGLMTKNKKVNRALIDRARRQMVGVWEIITEKLPQRNINSIWEFKNDGTFTLNVGQDYYHSGYQGIWDITADSEHVILYFTRSESPEEVYTIEMIKIQNVDYEDLVLSGDTIAKLTGHGDGLDKVYFEKDFQ